MIQSVAVIGAGTMGNGIAHVFTQNGFKVMLIDVSAEQLQKALSTIAQNMDRTITHLRIEAYLKIIRVFQIKDRN